MRTKMSTVAAGMVGVLAVLTSVNVSASSSEGPWTRTAWGACEDGAAMLKALAPQAGSPGSKGRRPLVLAMCECARLALPYVRKGDNKPLAAIKTAERWARGEGASLKQVEAASVSSCEDVSSAYLVYMNAASDENAIAAAYYSGSSASYISSLAAAAATAAAYYAAYAALAADSCTSTADSVANATVDAASASYVFTAAIARHIGGYDPESGPFDTSYPNLKAAGVAAHAADASADAVKATVLRKVAAIVRKYFPDPPSAVTP